MHNINVSSILCEFTTSLKLGYLVSQEVGLLKVGSIILCDASPWVNTISWPPSYQFPTNTLWTCDMLFPHRVWCCPPSTPSSWVRPWRSSSRSWTMANHSSSPNKTCRSVQFYLFVCLSVRLSLCLSLSLSSLSHHLSHSWGFSLSLSLSLNLQN